MLTRHLALSQPLLEADPPSGGGNPPATPPDPKPDEVTFDARQQEKLNALLAAERKRTEEATAARLKQEQADAKAKADADAERARQEAAGEFDAVKQSLTSERDAAVTERDSLKTERDTLLALVKADVDAAWDGLPDEVKDAYAGEPDDVLGRKQHMTRMAKVIAALTTKTHTPGNGPNPPASDGTRDLKAALTEARANPKYSF